MGKHERGLIKEAEKIIVKLLNSEKVSPKDKKNRWFNHSVVVANKLKEDLGSVKCSKTSTAIIPSKILSFGNESGVKNELLPKFAFL